MTEHASPAEPPIAVTENDANGAVAGTNPPTDLQAQALQPEPADHEPHDQIADPKPSREYANGVQEWAEEVSNEVAAQTPSQQAEAAAETQQNQVDYSDSAEQHTTDREVNGHSYSPAPDKSTINESSQAAAVVQVPAPQNGSNLSGLSGVPSPSPLSPISQHLLQLSSTKEWADWVLTINPVSAPTFASYAHGLVLIRSERLRAFMDRAHNANYASNVISLSPPLPVVPHAFEAALRFLYSDTVLSKDSLYPNSQGQVLGPVRSNLLTYIISYWVCGIELGLEPVVARSSGLFEDFLDWDVAELAMKEAYELEDSVIQGLPEQNLLSSYADAAVRMQQAVLRFCGKRISPKSYRVQTDVQPTIMRSRLGQLEDSRSRHNPALAAMRFGSMPSSTDLSPSSPQSEILPIATSMENQAGASILLNISFENLEYFAHQLKQLYGAAGVDVISQVIGEREARRTKAVSNRSVPNKQRMSNSATWDIAGWREYIDVGQVKRERVGFALPTKQR